MNEFLKGCVKMKLLVAVKQLLLKYKHGVILSYFFIYLTWFFYLEHTVTTHYTVIHTKLDDYIPFNEMFIIPYLLWFLYILVTILYFFLTSKQDFYKCCAFLFTGMTICLIIYTVFPNGTHNLRANLDTLGRHNIFTFLVGSLYHSDTPTNVFPSIHVFNSIGAYIAIHKSERLNKIKWISPAALALTILICLSTVFLKQHSTADVLGGIALSLVMYSIVYIPSWGKNTAKVEARKQELSKIS